MTRPPHRISDDPAAPEIAVQMSADVAVPAAGQPVEFTVKAGNVGGAAAPPAEISPGVSVREVKSVRYAGLSWSGATSTNVDVYRGDALVTTTPNDGVEKRKALRLAGPFCMRIP